MLSKVKLLIVLVLLGCTGAALADPPGRVGRLNYASGAVSFAPAEAQDDWTQAVLNRPLTSGDRLWVDRDGRAELHAGSTAVRLAGHTALDVVELDDDRLRVRLPEGTLNIRVRELDREEVIEVATPTAAVLLREPGSYRVSVDSRDTVARVTVHFGRAEVLTPERAFEVPSSQALVVSPNSPPSFEVAAYAAADEFDRWSAERDRRADRAVSARYVSRQMTGFEDLDDHGSWRAVPEYGHVWVPSRVPPDWAPYRHGHWAWISPWGWTWIDDAPWGFAPSHYGRWVWLDRHWAWAPGPIVRRPVYAPALVAFVGGSGWSVAASAGPAVGWFPLGWREPFIPWYRSSTRHVQQVNAIHVSNTSAAREVRYVNRSRPEAVTVVSQQTFVSSRPVWRERHHVRREDIARAEVIRDRVPAEPVRASFGAERPAGPRPPVALGGREVVVSSPGAFTREGGDSRDQRVFGSTRRVESDTPPVRVVPRERADFGGSRGFTQPPDAGRMSNERAFRRLESPPQSDATRDDRRERRAERPQAEAAARVFPDASQRERRAQQEAAERAMSGQQRTQAYSENRDVVRRAGDTADNRDRERRGPQTSRDAQQRVQPSAPPASTAPQAPAPAIQPPPSPNQPQVRQQSNDEGRGGDRRVQRQTPRDRD